MPSLVCALLQCTALGGVDVDVSINDDRGIRAARWLLRCQQQWPALRPLTLLLKAVLRVLELHDVSQGQLARAVPAAHQLGAAQQPRLRCPPDPQQSWQCV